MEMLMKSDNIKVKFNFEGKVVEIKCKRSEYIKDIIKQYTKNLEKDLENIFFLYKGNTINKEMEIEEMIKKEENELQILVYELENDDKNEQKLKDSEVFICPSCKEMCLFNISDYKIYLNNCKNNHCFSNLILN